MAETELNLSDEEVKAEFAKIQHQRDKQKAYQSQPEVKARMAEYQKLRADRKKAVLARAQALGLTLD